jgi:hypothetical protein
VSSQFPRGNVITRQRLLSDNFNKSNRLVARGVILGELARSLGDDYLASAAGRGGVIGGFLVRCLAGSNTIEVAAGIGFVATTPTSATYDPPVLWIEIDSPQTVDLASLIDGGNPRLVTIELQPAEVSLVTAVVDVFDPGTGTFTVDPTAAQVVGSEPTIVASAGAAAAAPVVAGGTVGRLPIAVVKLAAGQVSFTDEFASVLMCRPMLDAGGERMIPRDYVAGGGCSVGEESGGAIVNLTNVYLSRMTASILGLEAELAGLIVFATRGRTPDTTSPTDLLTDPQPVYGYAAPPPWADDYGPLAPREAWQRNPNAVTFASTQNIVGGGGSTFISLSAQTTSSPGRTLRNAIVIWDVEAPYGLERGAGNAPLQVLDARGPHPDTAPGGAGSITLDATQDPTWGPDQEITETAYLGGLSSLGIALDFMAQRYEGSGEVRLLDIVDAVGATHRRPLGAYTTTVVGSADFYPTHYPDMLVGDVDVFPTTTDSISLYAYFVTGVAGVVGFSIGSGGVGFGQSELDAALVPYIGNRSIQINGALSGAVTIAEEFNRITIDAGRAAKRWMTAGAGTSLAVAPTAYTDLVIAAR